ncbi:Probable xyloglucan endotransglucosylase/hydrolase protein 30 [Ancistrocladus abbreviatus]
MDRLGSVVIRISLSLLLSLFFFAITSAPAAARSAASFNLPTISFDEGYAPLFADFNVHRSDDGSSANLVLNRHAGSGFISSKYYDYGFFSAKIKLPGNHTAGVVVAFYTSNGDVLEKNHDELDIEFLGNIKGKPWRFQTNLYGNGSTSRGREERYKLWFDPTKDFHQYSILWTPKKIIFYVDKVPIREVVRNEAMGGDYPSKPMSLYATIWDASSWATSGGRYGVQYEYEPFVSEFTDFVLEGCPVDPLEQLPDSLDCLEKKAALEAMEYSEIRQDGRQAMKWFRERYMYYSYCYDTLRYPVPPPECVVIPSEQVRFKDSGRLKFEAIPRRQPRRKRSRGRRQAAKVAARQADI